MATNRKKRRAARSKKGSTKRSAKGSSNGAKALPAIPTLSASQKRRLRKLSESVNQLKQAIADLEMRKARALAALGAEQGKLQEAIRGAMQGAGIDFEEGPQGSWGLDLDTMEISFEPQQQSAVVASVDQS